MANSQSNLASSQRPSATNTQAGPNSPSCGTSESIGTDTQEVARLKRTIAELQDKNGRMQAEQEARDKPNRERVFVSLGRAFRRLVSLYDDPRVLVNEFDKRAEADELTDDEDEDHPAFRDVNSMNTGELHADRTYHGYKALHSHIPEAIKYLERADVSPSDINVMYKTIKDNGDKARADDTSTLKQSVVYWIQQVLPNAPRTALDRLLSHPRSKDVRGLQNDATAELLCPVDWDWGNEGVRNKVKDRSPEYQITSADFPRFFFSMKDHDPEDLEKTLFRGPLLLRAFKCIYTSPSSAMDFGLNSEDEDSDEDQVITVQPPCKRQRMLKQPTRSSVAEILNLKRVTGRSIAYVCVQVHFALSDLGQWSRDVAQFDYEAFYYGIVDYFERPPGPQAEARAKVLLQWWTEAIFGKARADPSTASAAGSVSRLAAQRLAKEAAS
ncbi:uncharacterized protein C8Q71DRAFT_863785 [Rhodofomes roseus]|uniref:Uncharacterized protein n=1 Tax=Rhodofomes roseus TaxID=34475 RepID=A0ABQ8JXS1_9APHY|nr:uncharacterized protein C8Q71DRAFT_863785 [Rhodofomes roseus]KAH9828719.1 hypothetical protein C8Q71DRAFT_863785 [Rhodofomes roseus]